MIILKSRAEIERLKKANQIVVEVMDAMEGAISPGIATGNLDKIAEELIFKRGARPAFKGYRGYKHSLCASVNEEVVHGVPGKRVLNDGDIIGIDCGVYYDGVYGDMAKTFPVGNVSVTARRLVDITEKALYKGIEVARAGNRLYDISAAVQEYVEAAGFSVVRDFTGHGVGLSLHEDPQVPNFGTRGTGMLLKPGLVLALEPMVNEKDWRVKIKEDGWTVVTADGGLSAHFEHTIAIMEEGTYILTKRG